MTEQRAPFAIQIELTEGCPLQCDFCGIRGIRSNPGGYKFMSMETVRRIVEDIKSLGWASRIEFAMHGEPTVNLGFIQIIRYFREQLDNSLMLLSNGYGFRGDRVRLINNLFNAGLNCLAIDDYKESKWSKDIRCAIPDITIDKSCMMFDYPNDGCKATPHQVHSKSTCKLVFIQDIEDAMKGGHSKLCNHCGCAFPPLEEPLKKRCTRPFRELSIRWDGTIALCCNDFRGVYHCGDVNWEPLQDIWRGRAFQVARQALYHRDRNFEPCKGCDATSTRVGLLPDHLGQEELEKNRPDDRYYLNLCSGEEPYTKPVLRPWEKE
jgi:hypothetical protein